MKKKNKKLTNLVEEKYKIPELYVKIDNKEGRRQTIWRYDLWRVKTT